jgi:DNA-binding beta-propeller fold protein YncE
MAEDEDSVMFLDADTDALIKTLPGFKTPHFARFSHDGRWAFVANIGAHHITRVDMQSLAIAEHIALDGFGTDAAAPDEGGFADAQIDGDGMLYAAHNATGKVLVYDTRKLEKKPELTVGKKPWIVYAEHPFANLRKRHVVPSFGDRSASILDANTVLTSLPIADEESFGVNYSSLAPDQAFLMNRFKKEIAVVDTAQMRAMDRIDVGGTTETASTTPDGRLIVATVSSANAVVVIDAVTHEIVKRFENVGKYPWSVTIPRGQNYCH